MKITFHGAALNVTGSKHLVETNSLRVLFDCGLHQGPRHEVGDKNHSFPFDPKSIDAVILSHAHADHCGMLPLLVKQGFAGKIYATPATRDVAEYIMLDSCHIQAQDAEYFNTHLPEGEKPIEPLYDEHDVTAALQKFELAPYFLHSHEWTNINETVRFKFLDAGHILGSSIIVLESQENSETKTIAFSGDLGAANAPILRDPEIPNDNIDLLMLECTYGNKIHRELDNAESEIIAMIHHAAGRRQKIIVPAFSLGRTQELVYLLHKLTESGKIPRIPIYVDSPLASRITTVFSKYMEEYDRESLHDFARTGEPPLEFSNLTYTASVEESKALNTLPGPWMVISASGMCEAGRILHHLKNHISDSKTIIAFTGFQAKGTLGRKILEGINPVKIFGRFYEVGAQVKIFNELSAHGDQKDLLEFARKTQPKQIALVHTEIPQSEEFRALLSRELPDIKVQVPEEGEFLEV